MLEIRWLRAADRKMPFIPAVLFFIGEFACRCAAIALNLA
jgi:hypothetical protein